MADLAGKKVAYYGFTGVIEPNNATKLAAAFNAAVNNGYDEVYLCINSVGGYVGDGVFLYNHMRGLPIKSYDAQHWRPYAHRLGSVCGR